MRVDNQHKPRYNVDVDDVSTHKGDAIMTFVLETRSLVDGTWTVWTETTQDSASLVLGMFYRPLQIGETISVPYAQVRRVR